MAIYGTGVGIWWFSGNYFLSVIPLFAGAFHLLYKMGGVSNIQSSIDLNRLQKRNKKFREVFVNLKSIMMGNKEAAKYLLSEETIVIINPVLEDFQFRDKGLVNRLDEKRHRYLFNWKIEDASMHTKGRIQGLVIHKFHDNEFDFEKLTFYLEKPDQKNITLVEFKVDADAEEIYPKDTPKGTQRSKTGGE
jgi:hypothetical protein